MRSRSRRLAAVTAASLVLGACGGGTEGGTDDPTTTTTGAVPSVTSEGPGDTTTTSGPDTDDPRIDLPALPDACDLLEAAEAAEFGVEPTTATSTEGAAIEPLHRVNAQWCRWSSEGAPSRARSLLLKVENYESANAAAAAVAWIDEYGSDDHFAAPRDDVTGVGDPAITTDGEIIPGATALNLGGGDTTGFAHRYGSIVVARFGPTLVQLSSAVGGSTARTLDLPLPDLERRSALVAEIARRADLHRDDGSSPIADPQSLAVPLRTGGTADLRFDGIDPGPALAVTCQGKSSGNSLATGSVTVAYEDWTLSFAGGALLFRSFPRDGDSDPTAFYGLLGDGALIGGIEVIKPGTGTVEAGADFAPITIDAEVQGVGRYATGDESGGAEPSTWSGLTDRAEFVTISGTVACDDADGEWWRTRPLRGLSADREPATVEPIPTVTTTPALTTTTTTTEAPGVVFPVPFCSSMMTNDEVVSFVGGGTIAAEYHNEDFETCSWFLDRDGFPAWVTFEIDHLGAQTLEEWLANPGTYRAQVIDDPGPGGDWPPLTGEATNDGVYVQIGEWMVYVEILPYLSADQVDLRGLAEHVIEQLQLRVDER